MGNLGVVIPASEGTLQWARKVVESENMKYIQFQDFSGDPNLTRKPDYYIYIFNISQQAHIVNCPPSWPWVKFAACPKGKPYLLVGRVASTINERWIDSASGATLSRGTYGERFATNLLNPANLGTNIWDDVSSWTDQGSGDLTRSGLFWTYNETPTAEELQKCRFRLVTHYQRLVEQANMLAAQHNEIEINPEHHAAADYLKFKTPWHSVIEVPEECPNCGEATKRGAAFHRMEDGVICVIDWPRTLNAGVRKLSDVPESLRSAQWYRDLVPESPEDELARLKEHAAGLEAEAEVRRGPGRPRKTEQQPLS